jgi:uncharacterized OsmC-like protein
VEGARADEHPRIWTEIWVKFSVTGHQIDPRAVERAIELSRDKYCPAAATPQPSITITRSSRRRHKSHEPGRSLAVGRRMD